MTPHEPESLLDLGQLAIWSTMLLAVASGPPLEGASPWPRRARDATGAAAALAAVVAALLTGNTAYLLLALAIVIIWWLARQFLGGAAPSTALLGNLVLTVAYAAAVVTSVGSAGSMVPVEVENRCSAAILLGPLGSVPGQSNQTIELPQGRYGLDLLPDAVVVKKGLLPGGRFELQQPVTEIRLDDRSIGVGESAEYRLDRASAHRLVVICGRS